MDLLFQETWEQWLGQELEKKARELRRALALGMNLGFSVPPRAAGL